MPFKLDPNYYPVLLVCLGLSIILGIWAIPPVVKAVRNLFHRDSDSGSDWTVIDANGSQRLGDTEEGKLYAIVAGKNECPDCHHHGFYEGPTGGMSVNIFCMNIKCRSGFNVTSFGDKHGTCDRISQGDISRYPDPNKAVPVTGTAR